jgi:hypothetical protein
LIQVTDKNEFREQVSMPSLGDISGLHEGLKVVFQLNNNGQPIGVGSEKLSPFGSLLVKTMAISDWRKAPKKKIYQMWEIMQVIFKLFDAYSVYCLFKCNTTTVEIINWIVEQVVF